MDEKTSKKHLVTMMDRERLTLTGVTEVFAFNEEVIELETVDGYMDIEGMDLQIIRMNLDSGELIVQGRVSALIYQDQVSKKKGSVFSKLFK